jgi:DNA-binding transcriptional LysR family regulator
MNLEPNDLLLFARVVDARSFTRAAERLGVPKSTVSRRIAALEAMLGERLLLRTTRQLTVTDFGASMLEYAHQVVAEVEAAAALAQDRQLQPTGRLRVSMPHDMATDVLADMLARFVADYPAVTLELDLTPRRVDLIGENFDVAIRMGDLQDDASLAARRVAQFATSLYAAPSYLARRGEPAAPEELMRHDTLPVLARSGEPQTWVLLRDTDNTRWEGRPTHRATVNSPGMLARLACAGAGIIQLDDNSAEAHLRSGALVPVLAEWRAPPVDAWAVFPGRRLMPRRTRVFLDAIAEELSAERCSVRRAQLLKTRTQAIDASATQKDALKKAAGKKASKAEAG